MAERSETSKAQIKLRLREPLRAELEAEAKQRGFSLNTEIVRRLENSLQEDKVGESVFGRKDIFAMVNLFSQIIRAYEITYGKRWDQDINIFKLAADSIYALFAKAPELFETGAWPGGIRTMADQGALAMLTSLINMEAKVADSDA